MDKKSTVLLTVIAVATLLVAVVGSTFAFFAIQQTNDAKVDVTTTTAAESDVFSATGSGALTMTINNDNMLETNGGAESVAASATDSSMVISLSAGTGTATCTYDLVWAETSATAYAKSATAADYTKEFTLAGSSAGLTAIDEINIDAIAEDGVLGSYEISNTAGGEATTQNWTFNTKFYNLDVDQAAQRGMTYAGNVTVQNVQCTNTAN